MISAPLKWVGGKAQIMDKVLASLPMVIDEYHEPFVGGGSVLIALLQSGRFTPNAHIYASDVNVTLISIYNHIKTNVDALCASLKELEEAYYDADDKEALYYEVRKSYNEMTDRTTIEASSAFIFMNKTGFRGICRYGPNGFNVPFGNYKAPSIYNESNLRDLSRLFERVTFRCCSWEVAVESASGVVYLDPPYVPEKKNGFVGYVLAGFDTNTQNRLFNWVINNGAKVHVAMSNNAVPSLIEMFTPTGLNIHRFSAKRSINSKDPSAKTDEVIISTPIV